MQGVKMIREKGKEIKVRKGIRKEEGLKDDENTERLFFMVE
jgi:hypothetical protein